MVRKVLPGRPGTKKFLEQYGEDLVCVRYRYDSKRREKLKTIEIVVEKSPWRKTKRPPPKNKIVGLKIEYGEIELGRLVKEMGGKWNRSKRVWEIAYGDAEELGLVERIVNL